MVKYENFDLCYNFNNDFKYYNKWNIGIFKGKEKISYII